MNPIDRATDLRATEKRHLDLMERLDTTNLLLAELVMTFLDSSVAGRGNTPRKTAELLDRDRFRMSQRVSHSTTQAYLEEYTLTGQSGQDG